MASSPSPSTTWPTRSSRSRCSAATTSPATRCAASAAPAGSTPARWPTRSASDASSSTRWPACCRPTASASPTSARCAQQAIEAPLDAALAPARGGVLDDLAADARRELRRPARAGRAHRDRARGRTCATPAPTRRWRCPLADAAGDARRLRARAPARATASSSTARPLVVEAVTVEGIGADGRDRRAGRPLAPRGPRRHRAGCHGDAVHQPAPHQPAEASTAPVFAREALRPGDAVAGPALIAGATATTRGRARLAAGGDPARPSDSRPRRAAAAAGRASAPLPIRSCSRSSTISSCRSPSRWASRCRTPPIRSTSRSGWISPARCSTPTGR